MGLFDMLDSPEEKKAKMTAKNKAEYKAINARIKAKDDAANARQESKAQEFINRKPESKTSKRDTSGDSTNTRANENGLNIDNYMDSQEYKQYLREKAAGGPRTDNFADWQSIG